VLRAGKLVLLRQDRAASSGDAQVRQESFESAIEKVSVEQRGPVRAVIKIEGKHSNGTRQWLPFTLRLYFYAGADSLRVLHTIVFDGDESKDFIRGIGLRFSTPVTDELYDRHVRFVGDQGLFAEAVRGLTGLRRDPGASARKNQLDGLAAGPISPVVTERAQYIPAFGDWTMLQPNANSFTIRKRTADGHAWLDSGQGHRASGLGYVGGPTGGIAFGIRNFWQSHPAQLDIRHAHEAQAEVTMWVWAPDATPMDLRFYHDGMGQDTYEKQTKGGLEITYEDYEPGFGTPMGVARTSELMLWILPSTPAARGYLRARRRVARACRHGADAADLVRLRRLRPFVLAAVAERTRTCAAREAARLDVRFLSRTAGPARLVRLLELRRRHAHVRLRSPRVAIRRRRLRLGQLRARDRSLAVALLPAHGPRRHVPVRRGHDPATRAKSTFTISASSRLSARATT
jgi:hypothetical protein